MFAPIALFVYKRVDHTRSTIEALQANRLSKDSDLIIYSDGPKGVNDKEKVEEVRLFIRTITGFKTVQIIESPVNMGLAKSIIQGVTSVLKKYDSVIVVEDDLVSSPYFLSYMNQGLSLYRFDSEVISIHGYVYPLKGKLPESFFLKGADCWGWATWRHGWELFEPDGNKLLQELEQRNLTRQFDFEGSYPYTQMLRDQIEGKNDSWAIRWYASAFLKGKLTLYPGASLINNIGHDNSGSHSGRSSLFDVALKNTDIELKRIPLIENSELRQKFISYFLSFKPGFLLRILKRIKMMLIRKKH
ncbi:MAG: glycosyltransferase family 2 protein [Bacteroidetes bacterium]|nr:glycosyltransferase family 2 protein [Bacteroidota bacterium]